MPGEMPISWHGLRHTLIQITCSDIEDAVPSHLLIPSSPLLSWFPYTNTTAMSTDKATSPLSRLSPACPSLVALADFVAAPASPHYLAGAPDSLTDSYRPLCFS